MAKDRYSVAVVEIYKFEKLYPDSEYLCELYQIQVAWRSNMGYDADDIREKRKQKCSGIVQKKKK